MALFSEIKKKSALKSAKNEIKQARKKEGAESDQHYKSAYEGFAGVVSHDLTLADALYNWGFALLHQGKSKSGDDAAKLFKEAIDKFTFCLLVEQYHLGAAIDGGVAYMDLARAKQVAATDELYVCAKEFFETAEDIQKGSAAYNLACVFAVQGEEDKCQNALKISCSYNSLPDVEDIVNDSDLAAFSSAQWFTEFVEKVKAGPETEKVDPNEVQYDVEGNPIIERKKDNWRNPETEVDGVVYDVEGNVVRRLDENSDEKQDSADDTASSEKDESSTS